MWTGKTFEYLEVDKVTIAKLNKLGALGWQAVTLVRHEDFTVNSSTGKILPFMRWSGVLQRELSVDGSSSVKRDATPA